MEILTKRCILRDFSPEDEPAFQAYHKDSRFQEFYSSEETKPEHAGELIHLFRAWAAAKPRLNYQLAIIRRDEAQTLIGCCGLRSAGSKPGEAELGIELSPQYWGRYGHAVEIVRALAEFGFGNLGLQVIFGSAVSANFRVARLARSFGAEVMPFCPTPAWMSARGWSKVRWQVSREKWESDDLSRPDKKD